MNIDILKYRLHMRLLWIKAMISARSWFDHTEWLYEYHGHGEYGQEKYWYYYLQEKE